MARNKTSFVSVIIILGVALLLSGCASLGPVYQKPDRIPEDKGLVYLYRSSSFVGGGVSYDIKVGEIVITTLYNGGYYPYFAAPGEVELWAQTESKSSVTVDVKAGQTYYVKGTVGIGFIVGRPHLALVSTDVGEKEIVECKLIPEEKDQK